MEHLANILQQLSKSGELQNVVNILQRSAQESPDSGSAASSVADVRRREPEPEQGTSSSTGNRCWFTQTQYSGISCMRIHYFCIGFNDVSDVVWHYQQKQANDRAGSSSKSRDRSSATSPRCYSVCYNLCVFVLSIFCICS